MLSAEMGRWKGHKERAASPRRQAAAEKGNVLAQAVELIGEGGGNFHAIDSVLDFIEAGDKVGAFWLVHRAAQVVFEQQERAIPFQESQLCFPGEQHGQSTTAAIITTTTGTKKVPYSIQQAAEPERQVAIKKLLPDLNSAMLRG